MKQKVIEFFQNLPVEKHEQFNEAFKLYRESPNKNVLTERSYNSSGYTERSLENLMYDLQKIHEISDVEKVAPVKVLKLEVESEEDEIFIGIKSILELDDEKLALWADKRQNSEGDVQSLLDYAISKENEEFILVLTKAWESLDRDLGEKGPLELNPDSEIPGTQEQTTDVDTLKEENETLKSENEDLQFEKEELESEKEELEEEVETLKEEVETLKLAPKLDAKQIRVEFPFLNEKDCPDEFKILVADKITAWNRYLDLQEDIANAESGKNTLDAEKLALIANEAVKCFDENQKIYDELNAYQTTGKVLGSHFIFKKLQLTREVETMSNDELIKYKNSSAKYFSDNKKLLAKAVAAKDEPRILEINTRVADREVKLALVNKKLGVK